MNRFASCHNKGYFNLVHIIWGYQCDKLYVDIDKAVTKNDSREVL